MGADGGIQRSAFDRRRPQPNQPLGGIGGSGSGGARAIPVHPARIMNRAPGRLGCRNGGGPHLPGRAAGRTVVFTNGRPRPALDPGQHGIPEGAASGRAHLRRNAVRKHREPRHDDHAGEQKSRTNLHRQPNKKPRRAGRLAARLDRNNRESTASWLAQTAQIPRGDRRFTGGKAARASLWQRRGAVSLRPMTRRSPAAGSPIAPASGDRGGPRPAQS